MNTTWCLARCRVRYALTIGTLSLIGVSVLGEVAGGQPAKRDARMAVRLVDAIANSNKPPKLVDRPSGRPKRVPLFPESYDWEEEERVLDSLDKLYRDTTAELWEELVRRQDDPGYCITVMDPAENAHIRSVGSICGQLAESRLVSVFEQHLPLDPDKDGASIVLDIGINSLMAWRKRRSDKALYQLQIEVCEQALGELSKVERISEKEKDLTRKKIETEIKRLRRTQEPDLPHFTSFRGFEEVYTPRLAKRIREAVKNGFTGHIELSR